MKKVFLMVMLVLALSLNYSFAQMGGGMMGGQEDTKGHMQEMKAQKGMMTPEKTQEQMKEMTDQMSEMMQKMAGKMKDMKTDEMKDMSKIDAGHVQTDAGHVDGDGKRLGQNTRYGKNEETDDAYAEENG